MEPEKRKRTQLNMDIDPEMHRLIKMAATLHYISINKWVMRAIEKQLIQEGHIEIE